MADKTVLLARKTGESFTAAPGWRYAALSDMVGGQRVSVRFFSPMSRWKRFVPALAIGVTLLGAFGESAPTILVIVTVLNLVLREQFPFSHFPMYADFSPRPFYLRVTDDADRPVRLDGVAWAAQLLTKVYTHERRLEARRLGIAASRLSAEQLRGPGERALVFLAERAGQTRDAALPDHIRLYEVELTLSAGRIERHPRLVGVRCRS